MRYTYEPEGTCAKLITFDLDGDAVRNIEFAGGCKGNLKALSKLLDGVSPDEIAAKLLNNTCGSKPTSCADQLARAVLKAADEADYG